MHNPLSETGRQIVLGTMMGDGYLFFSSDSRHAGLEVTHMLDSEDYVLWKYKYLEPLCRRTPNYYSHERNGTLCHRVRFRTLTHSFFTRLHNYCYPDGKRAVSGKVLNSLNAVGLSTWWMDDGNLCVRKRPSGYPSRTIDLHIERYSYHDCDVIRRWFAEKFSITAKLVVHYFSYVQERPLLYLRFSVWDAYHVLRPYLAPVVEQIPSMRRKLDFQFSDGKNPGRRRINKPGQSAYQVVRAWMRKYPHLIEKYPHAMP